MQRVLAQLRQRVYRRITDVILPLKHEGLSGRIEDVHEAAHASLDKTTQYRSGNETTGTATMIRRYGHSSGSSVHT